MISKKNQRIFTKLFCKKYRRDLSKVTGLNVYIILFVYKIIAQSKKSRKIDAIT